MSTLKAKFMPQIKVNYALVYGLRKSLKRKELNLRVKRRAHCTKKVIPAQAAKIVKICIMSCVQIDHLIFTFLKIIRCFMLCSKAN